jgi:hypothetical protein
LASGTCIISLVAEATLQTPHADAGDQHRKRQDDREAQREAFSDTDIRQHIHSCTYLSQ